MIGLAFIYAVGGFVFAIFALLAARDRRFANAAFWALIALSMWAGDRLGDLGNGILAIALVLIAASGRMRTQVVIPAEAGISGGGKTGLRQETPEIPASAGMTGKGNWLFLPALVIPVTALVGTLVFKHFPDIFEAKQTTLVALTFGVILALGICYVWLRPRPAEPFAEGGRLMDAVGWAAVLPQMLTSLGAVFALAGVGDVVGQIAGAAIPGGSVIGAVIAYALGMALFTIVMGNAFAAFPVMAAAIGVPLLIHQYHGDPAVIAAIGMLAGFCGTLLTPMAANFNIVPAALLNLSDRYGVIKRQAGTALPLLAVNIGLLYWLAFR
ncbi:DUF979 domain-containing protein [Sphingomonas crocodyli]|uniref:DUF979 domain-containing protein n=1 Tax=Sphingomonas crocodyli TaxID=1979270 RepID=A0A437LUW9_9SPHN|nr:DUF979 domain-containing protein [Sphingomonas crocodyli]RVT89166.1 DUF979 domain-containing protein [Sphingomonas crocodyli]